jgi:hypothetical protein
MRNVKTTLSRIIVALAGLAIALAFGLVGCGSLPDAKVNYYQARSQITVKVTRSVICDTKNFPVVANVAAPNVTHSADLTKPRATDLAGLRGSFTDADIKFEFYEDGRLKTVNAIQTGQGDAVVKAATTLATTIAAFSTTSPLPSYPTECTFIKEVGGGKPLSLIYEGVLNLSKNDSQIIPADGASAAYASRLSAFLGGICAKVGETEVSAMLVEYTGSDAVVTATAPAMVWVEVGTLRPGNLCVTDLWKGRLPVAQLGKEYKIPLPKAVAFGKQTLSLAFAESGAVTSMQYTNASGAAGALGAVNALASIAQPESTTAKTTDLKNQADEIVQEQRLLQCKAEPKTCK